MNAKELSYTMRHTTPTHGPPVQPCCGKAHPLPFQHRRYYVDKRGHSKYDLECSRCYRTLEERGLKPSNIRFPKRRIDAYCEQCCAELESGKAHESDDEFDVFATIAKNRDGA